LPLLLGRYKPGRDNVRLIFGMSAVVEVERIFNHAQYPGVGRIVSQKRATLSCHTTSPSHILCPLLAHARGMVVVPVLSEARLGAE
jgi:hypothetical protein